jgi:excisionase family DNA binding protein
MKQVERETYDFGTACQVLGIGETTGRKKRREGRLPVLRIGRRVLVTKATIDAILRGEISLNDSTSDNDNRAA